MSDWKYFSYEGDEMLACPCCGEEGMDNEFMEDMDSLRNAMGHSLVVNSGYRCPNYNSSLSTTGRDGPHTTGKAIDFSVTDSRTRSRLIQKALRLGYTRIGVAKTFIHIDGCNSKAQDVMWMYQ